MREENLWQEQARQMGGEALVAVIQGMARNIEDMKNSIDELTASAFPGGDVEGHRRYHQLIIERNQELRRLRIAIAEKTISGLIWSAVLFLGACVWAYLTGKKV